jgi:hypothetical protein
MYRKVPARVLVTLRAPWGPTGYHRGAYAVPMGQHTGLDRLREQFPGWRFGTVWTTAATGPDVRRLTATKDGILLSAWNAAELAQDIRREEES